MIRSALSLLILIMTISGCSSNSTPEKRYSLLQSQGQAKSAQQISQSLIIGPVLLPSEINRNTMVVRNNDGSLSVDDRYKWAGDLDDQLARLLAVEIENQLSATLVVTEQSSSSTNARYAVSIDVNRWDNLEKSNIRLEASWAINRRQDKGPLAVGRSVHNAKADGSIEGSMQAMSEVAKMMATDIAQVLRRHGL